MDNRIVFSLRPVAALQVSLWSPPSMCARYTVVLVKRLPSRFATPPGSSRSFPSLCAYVAIFAPAFAPPPCRMPPRVLFMFFRTALHSPPRSRVGPRPVDFGSPRQRSAACVVCSFSLFFGRAPRSAACPLPFHKTIHLVPSRPIFLCVSRRASPVSWSNGV